MMDRVAIDELVTEYAAAVDDADWAGFRALFTPDARLDYSGAGGIDDTVERAAEWVELALSHFPVRQHLIVNRRLRLKDLGGYAGDTAEVRADYIIPMQVEEGTMVVTGGRYTFGAVRTDAGWRLGSLVVAEKWRRAA